MADDIQDLGTTELWRITLNWKQLPKHDYDVTGRQLIGYSGTAKTLANWSDERPQILEFGVTVPDKARNKELLDHFLAVKGRHKRFWLLTPHNVFTLNGLHSAGVVSLSVLRNEFDFRGLDRFYILLNNGDLITRKMDSFAVDEENDTADIGFAIPTDRVLDPAAIALFGLVLLVRLDSDELNLAHDTDLVADATVRVVELVKEYSLA